MILIAFFSRSNHHGDIEQFLRAVKARIREREKDDHIDVRISIRKRPALRLIDDNAKRRFSKSNEISLVKMAQTTRTFSTQTEALEYMTQRQKNERNLCAVISSTK